MAFHQILESASSNIQRLFLDFDGVCVDSEYKAMKAALEIINTQSSLYGHFLNVDELILSYAGWHFDNMIKQVQLDMQASIGQGAVFSPTDLEKMQGKKKQRTLDELSTVQVLPGITDLIETNLLKGVPVAIVTSSEFERVNVCLQASGLNVFFDLTKGNLFCGPECVGHDRLKPKPDIYQFAQNHFYAGRAGHDLTVEDSLSGARAAVAASIPVVGYVGGSHIPDHQKDSHGKKLVEIGAVGYIQHYKF